VDTIDLYQIRALLGRGGMATVYRAFDPTFDREVAIKVLASELADNTRFRELFDKEAKVIASLDHPAIVPVHDYGEHEGLPYLVMRFMDGGSLADRLAAGPLDLREIVRIVAALAPALDKAHAKKVVHRDLKPGNILFDADGNPAIADFGIAMLIEAGSSQAAEPIGTPAYMSPEQATGSAALDRRSDIYSLGVMLYEMLTGARPYESETTIVQARQHAVDPVPHLRDAAPGLSHKIDRIAARAMAKQPGDRYATAGELARELQRAAGAAGPAAAPADRPAALDDRTRILPRPPAPKPAAPKPSTPAPDRLTIPSPIRLELVRVPAGHFWMGSDPAKDGEAHDDERPQRWLSLSEFYIGRYPVTNAQYAVFVREKKAKAPGHWPGGVCPSGKENHPVVDVARDDTLAFCAWLSQATGKEFRLPNEPEWEKAARGDDGRLYPWGNRPPHADLCNFSVGDGSATTPVDRYPKGASPYGALDMAGNVWEWTSSPFEPYGGSAPRAGSGSSGRYVVRGGSFRRSRRDLRCANRHQLYPANRCEDLGFRVVYLPDSSPNLGL
jgi:serine/threonine-protein kinase